MAADEQLILATAPVQSEQDRRISKVAIPAGAEVAESCHECFANRGQPLALRSASGEVSDQTARLDQATREEQIEAVGKGGLAQEPSAVCDVQRLGELVACGSWSNHRTSVAHNQRAVQRPAQICLGLKD